MNAELWDYFKELGCEEAPVLSEGDEEMFLRHRALCQACSGIDNCREHGCISQISLSPDKSHAYLTVGPCKFRRTHDVLLRSKRLFSEAAIPPALLECGFENYATEGRSESVQYAKLAARKAAETGSSLVLAGAVGTGKTHLAAAIAKTALNQGRPVFFISAIGYLEHLKSTFEEKQNGLYMKMIGHVKSISCLVIDDFGTERSSAWTIERLYDVLNTRIEHKLQTIITTNFVNAPALIKRMSSDPLGAERIVSRLLSFGWLAIEGEDYRVLLRKQKAESREIFSIPGGPLNDAYGNGYKCCTG
jgi:DNA replication protein DnaC